MKADRLEPTSPVAVLYPLKGEPWTMVIPSVLPEILVARRVPFSAHIEDPPSFETNHRRFRLSPHRSRTYRWWEIYNDGRSATPQDGFVYFEVVSLSQNELQAGCFLVHSF